MATKKSVASFSEMLTKFDVNLEKPRYEIRPLVLNDLWNGIHLGYLYSLWGDAGCGKTTIAIQVIRSLLQQGLQGVIVDVEKALNSVQLESFGLKKYVDEKRLFIVSCNNWEEFESIILSTRGAGINFLLVDSVTMLQMSIADDMSVKDVRPGLRSQQEKFVITKLKNLAFDENIACLLISHVTANLSFSPSPYAPEKKQSGGYTLFHAVDVITKISKGPLLKNDSGDPFGVEVKIVTEKNKFSTPNRVFTEKLIYGKGIDSRMSLIDRALSLGVIEQAGAIYTLPNGEKFKGKSALYKIADSNLVCVKEAVSNAAVKS